MLEAGEIPAWLRLLETPGVGRETARRLLAAFGSPEGVFDASPNDQRAVAGATVATALAIEPEGFAALLTATRQWIESDPLRGVLAVGDPAYPSCLLETADPPLLLYVQGRVELLSAVCLAVVGSRGPSPQGRENAHTFSRQFSEAGLTVVSGLAQGIDGAAHEGALLGPGSTIAVVGTGLDRVYPRRHLELAHRIAQQGLLVSEYAIGTEPLPARFPQRNRIIAGLSVGTVVVEAALQSGSLITARLAAEMGRDVFAIPGSIHAPQSRGCHALIKQGAKLVDEAQDVLDELRPGLLAVASPAASPARVDPVLDALGHDPATLDMLVERTGMPPQALGPRLLDLEIEGEVRRLPGGLFQRHRMA